MPEFRVLCTRTSFYNVWVEAEDSFAAREAVTRGGWETSDWEDFVDVEGDIEIVEVEQVDADADGGDQDQAHPAWVAALLDEADDRPDVAPGGSWDALGGVM